MKKVSLPANSSCLLPEEKEGMIGLVFIVLSFTGEKRLILCLALSFSLRYQDTCDMRKPSQYGV